jgi:hypothetical protein
MTIGRIFGILFFSSLAATGAALAGGIPKGPAVKGEYPLPVSRPASARHTRPQAPIVMGRSVSTHHKTNKTKLHHIKMKPLESIESPVTVDNTNRPKF